jgi:hypothetical protein
METMTNARLEACQYVVSVFSYICQPSMLSSTKEALDPQIFQAVLHCIWPAISDNDAAKLLNLKHCLDPYEGLCLYFGERSARTDSELQGLPILVSSKGC